MFKRIIIVSIFALALVATPASAAVILQEAGFTVNGDQSDSVPAGSTVRFGTTMTISNPSEVEYTKTLITDENGIQVQSSKCSAVMPRLVNQNDVVVYDSVKLVRDLPDQSLFVEKRTYGIPGLGVSDRCDEDNLNGSAIFEHRLFVERDSRVSDADTVVDNTGGNTGGTSGDGDDMKTLIELIRELIALQLTGGTGGTPAPAPKCEVQTIASGLYIGATDATTGGKVTPAQMYLVNHGFVIPAIQYGGASYGYWGQQSITALQQA